MYRSQVSNSKLITVLALAQVFSSSSQAQTPLDQAIAAKFPLTQATADRADIVTAGSVMTLKKNGIIMFATTAATKAQLVYKDGKISPSVPTRMAAFSLTGHVATNIVQRTYVAGEKLWLIDVKDANDGVVLQLLSDPVSDVRYTAFVKFPFAKGTTPTPEEEISQIAQVMTSDNGGAAPPASVAAAPAEAPPPAPMAPIAPPPPPPDQPAPAPPTLEKGQTRDQVVAMFGQPTRIVKMGAKEIDTYKDMKVTYTGGKVSNVE